MTNNLKTGMKHVHLDSADYFAVRQKTHEGTLKFPQYKDKVKEVLSYNDFAIIIDIYAWNLWFSGTQVVAIDVVIT